MNVTRVAYCRKVY